MATIETIIEKMKEKEPFGKELADLTNVFGFKPKEMSKAIIKADCKTEFLQLCYLWVSYLAFAYKKKHLMDDRNLYACQTGIVLSEVPAVARQLQLENTEKDYYSFRDKSMDSYLLETGEIMSQEHRTLQQTFSGWVFYFIAHFAPEYILADLNKCYENKDLYDDFWFCPMI